MAGADSANSERWFAVARSAELVARHIAQTELLGRELALWRDASGRVNAWENRCPHRGVRLSIGSNDGEELTCRYHAWRFAVGTGQCTYIPAHPTQKPAAALRVGVYAATEAGGFVWARLAAGAGAGAGGDPGPPAILPGLPGLFGLPGLPGPPDPPGAAPSALTLRSLYVDAPHAAVAHALHGYRFAVDPARDAEAAHAVITEHDPFTLTAAAAGTGGPARVLFFLQPQAASRTVIHGCLLDGARLERAERGAMLRHHNAQMTAVRDALERAP